MMSIRTVFWVVAISLGLLQAFAHRFDLYIDGVTYLDIADAYLCGDWNSAINSSYGPLYSWILAFAMFVLKPSPDWESSCLYLVNVVIYLFTLGCFEFFLNRLIQYKNLIKKEDYITLPDWIFSLIGYVFFIFCSLNMIGVYSQTPDMLVSAFVYLIFGIILHIQLGFSNWCIFFLLGLVLGFGYLTKEAMFPMAFIFLAVAIFSTPSPRKKILCMFITLIAFCIISGPFIIALSKSKGFLTYGESGRFNYALLVNKMLDNGPNEVSGYIPIHPMKKIFNNPIIYEYGNVFKEATYPFVYDPAYWYEGINPCFNLRNQLERLLISAEIYFQFFIQLQTELIIGLLIFFCMSTRNFLYLKDVVKQWFLIIPALVAVGMYSLINVELRYIAPYDLLLWISLFIGMRLPRSEKPLKVLSSVVISILMIIIIRVSVISVHDVYRISQNLVKGKEANISWQIASEVNQMGVSPGDKVGAILGDNLANWVRLAKLRIIAEMWNTPVDSFWGAENPVKSQIINAFAKTEARAIITANIPAYAMTYASKNGWKRIGDSNYYVYFLR